MSEIPKDSPKFHLEVILSKYNLTEIQLESLILEFCGNILETGLEDGVFHVEFEEKEHRKGFIGVIKEIYLKNEE